MKRLVLSTLGLVLTLAALAVSGAFAGAAPTAGPAHGGGHAHDFDRFLERYEAANTAFVNGDPSLWLTMTAEKDPASIFGGFGGLGESGVATVHERYRLAARAFQPSGAQVDFQYLVKDVRGKLAYTVAIERSQVLYTGQSERHDAGAAVHDDLPLRPGRLADRPPARGHDGGSGAAHAALRDAPRNAEGPRAAGPLGTTNRMPADQPQPVLLPQLEHV